MSTLITCVSYISKIFMIEGAKIRSKCKWHQHGEKPTKFFLNLEKQKAINTTKTLN